MSSQVIKRSLQFSPMDTVRGLQDTCRSALAHLPQRVLRLALGSLRAKCIVVIASLGIILMGAVTVIVETHQRQAILEQTRLRALSLGSSLAALSEGYLLSYNFIKLEQATESVTDREDDVDYTVAHLRDGRVAAFSGRNDLQGKILDDPISQRALQADQPLLQTITMPATGEPGYDVAIPVYVPGSDQKWGTLRLGFSLKRAYMTIRNTRRDLCLLGLAVICGSTVLAVLLATRISRPIGHLVSEVHEITRGSYDHPIQVDTWDEISYLASAFEQMRRSLQAHLAGLAEEKTRLEEANVRLQEAQQQLIHLAARVAHEVNNPLAIIKTAIRIIRKQIQQDDPGHMDLQVIEEEIDRIARIIREILAFSRPSHPGQVVEVNVVILSLASLLEQSLHEKQIKLSMVLEPELPQVQISADHLKQVILNMVRNAEDAMPEGGQLVMRTARNEKGVELSIADTGCGIPAEHLARLFDPFFTTKEKETERGMGLGLAVSSGIIRNANGSIEVESEIGKGTTFWVRLPAYKV